MANTFILGGSPLGLIGVRSRPTADGMSTFNAGKSRNINVIAYNTGRKQQTNISSGDGSSVNAPVSLFSGGSLPNFWPNISTFGTDKDNIGTNDPYNGLNRNTLHNNDVYDTSLLNIIEKLSPCPKASIRPQDFAYLKYLGVFPNNRLMIARRFLTPMKDNIMDKGGSAPKSVLISWKPEEENFLEFSFGEEWQDAEADFTNVLNKLGEDFGISGQGTGAGKALNVIPLPGFTELLQRKFLEGIGVLSTDDNSDTPLPTGNPNIIKMAKRRKTIGYGEAASGLKCSISITMNCEYEQKFISGIDPTVAWMDIVNNILTFGTSNSSNYGLSKDFVKKLNTWSNDVTKLIDDVVTILSDIFSSFKEDVKKLIDGFLEDKPDKTDKKPSASDLTAATDKLFNAGISAIKKTVQKYRIEIMGIAHALSGAPSTPWHVTVGNPLRPVFCSGDMLAGDVTLTLGPTLAFNDLPSNIKVGFTLTNARPLGLQEILAKFNTGHLRSVNVRKDYLEIDNGKPGSYFTNVKQPVSVGGTSSSGTTQNSVVNIATVTATTTKENNTQITQK